MKNTVVTLLGLILLVFTGCKDPQMETKPVEKDGIFVHISHGSDDAHLLLMGLQMAVKMSENKDVLVYLDINAVNIAVKDAEDVTYEEFPSSKTQIKALLAKGVNVMVCPACLKAAGKTEADLMEGLKIADKEKFFSFTKGRILTLDY